LSYYNYISFNYDCNGSFIVCYDKFYFYDYSLTDLELELLP